jgi:hypothetical protein
LTYLDRDSSAELAGAALRIKKEETASIALLFAVGNSQVEIFSCFWAELRLRTLKKAGQQRKRSNRTQRRQSNS